MPTTAVRILDRLRVEDRADEAQSILAALADRLAGRRSGQGVREVRSMVTYFDGELGQFIDPFPGRLAELPVAEDPHLRGSQISVRILRSAKTPAIRVPGERTSPRSRPTLALLLSLIAICSQGSGFPPWKEKRS